MARPGSAAAERGAPLVSFRGVRLGYEQPLLPPVDLEIAAGDFVGVVGPNGSGKTTLLRTLCGILRPLGGERSYPGGRPRIGYVPQRGRIDDIFPLTAREVVALNLVPTMGLLERLGRRHYRRADEWLARLDVESVAHMPFRHLSGGQKQRVLLARALAIRPELIVLDEPTSALDPLAEHRILSELSTLHRESGLAVVLVSHQLALTANVAQRLVIVDKERQVVRIGSSTELMSPHVLAEIYGREGVEHILGRRPRSGPASDPDPVAVADPEVEHG